MLSPCSRLQLALELGGQPLVRLQQPDPRGGVRVRPAHQAVGVLAVGAPATSCSSSRMAYLLAQVYVAEAYPPGRVHGSRGRPPAGGRPVGRGRAARGRELRRGHRTRSAAPAPPRLPRADLDALRRGPSARRRRGLGGRAEHHRADRARPGPRLRAGGRAVRSGGALRRRAAPHRPDRPRQPEVVVAARPRRSHDRRSGGRRAAARRGDRGAGGRDAPPARLPHDRPAAPHARGAAAVDRALVRGRAHRTPRRGRSRPPAVPALQ